MGWIVPELSADFTQDFEDMIIDYIFDKYIIFTPPKGATKIDADKQYVRFHPGYLDYRSTYEIAVLQGRTTVDYSEEMARRRMFCITNLNIMIRMNRLPTSPNWINPELGNMEREIARITRHYQSHELLGIKDFYFDDSERLPQRNNEFSASNWESNIYAKITYEKRNTDP